MKQGKRSSGITTGLRRAVSALVCAAMMWALPTAAMAADTGAVPAGAWDLSAGSITVEMSGDRQTVTQGQKSEVQRDPVIASSGSTANTITLKGSGVRATLSGASIQAQSTAAISVEGSATLTIQGQNTVAGGDRQAAVAVSEKNSLVIGGTGSLQATGGTNAAGIGGGDRQPAGSITIESGTVTAKSGDYIQGQGGSGAGIGGGAGGHGGTVTINGGSVNACSSGGGAGIGGGNNGFNSATRQGATVTITGGTIVAESGSQGAGIGGAYQRTATVTISGGDITATGGSRGAGIGSGYNQMGSENIITITGGVIKATGGEGAAGIGSGGRGSSYGSGGVITIGSADTTPTVSAFADGGAAAIGGGQGMGGGAITVYSGTVNATVTSSNGAAIGSGYSMGNTAIGSIDLQGGTITAVASSGGAAVGGGNQVSSGSVHIGSGAALYALAGDGAAAIGGGSYSSGGTDISIENGADIVALSTGKRWAVDTKNTDLSGVSGVLNGRFDGFDGETFVAASNALTADTDTQIALIDEQGQLIRQITLPETALGYVRAGQRTYHAFAVTGATRQSYIKNTDGIYGNKYTDYPTAEQRTMLYSATGEGITNIDHIRFVDTYPTRTGSYTVEHWVEGEQNFRDRDTVEAQIPLTEQMIPTGPVSLKSYSGYTFSHYDSADGQLPASIADGGVLRVYYGRDDSQQKALSYTVEHWVDGESQPRDVQQVEKTVWVQASALPVDPIAPNTYTGYAYSHTDPADLPAEIEGGGTIRVFYAPDYSQQKTISYTVEYRVAGEQQPRDTATVEKRVWLFSDELLDVQPVEQKTYADATFSRTDPAHLPQQVADGSVITVLYERVLIPVAPVLPVDPTQPAQPTDNAPAAPVVLVPAAPAVPDSPAAPNVPETPVSPETPATPVEPQSPEVQIQDPEAPLAELNAQWALLNLLLAIATALVSVLLIVGYILGKSHRQSEDESQAAQDREEDSNTLKRKGIWRLLSLVPGIGSIAVFLLTENMRDPMVFTDRWTLLMVLIAAVQLIISVLCIKRRKDDDEKDDPQAVKAQ